MVSTNPIQRATSSFDIIAEATYNALDFKIILLDNAEALEAAETLARILQDQTVVKRVKELNPIEKG